MNEMGRPMPVARIWLAIFACLSTVIGAACSSGRKAEEDRITNQIRARVALMEQQRQQRFVNENWYVDCDEDRVTAIRSCFARTSGQVLGQDGEPYGQKIIPFKVVYIGNLGPFVEVGVHDFPGRTPIVRVDHNEPIIVQDDGGVRASSPNPALVQQMLSGHIARATYHVWPKGQEQMYVNLTGFDQAWQRLNLIRKH